MKLFETKDRTYQEYAISSETTYSFLDRSAKPQFEEVRDRLNDWFSRYPENEKLELKSRLEDATHFDDAFFELYLHELFYSKGFSLEVHPSTPNSDNAPDFLVSKNDDTFYLEAKLVRDQTEAERKSEGRKGEIIEKLNKVRLPLFNISLRKLKILSQESFRINALKNAILRKVKSLDYLNMIANQESVSFIYADDQIDIELELFPRGANSIDFRNPRPIGVDSSRGAKWTTNHISIQKAIIKKAKHYGVIEYPMVLAINSISPTGFSLFDIEKMLGSDFYCGYSNKKTKIYEHHLNEEGLFTSGISSKLDLVSKLLITSITPYHNGAEELFLFNNPRGRNALKNNLAEELGLKHCFKVI